MLASWLTLARLVVRVKVREMFRSYVKGLGERLANILSSCKVAKK